MKGILKKTIAIFILMMMLINSSLLLVISTAIDEIDRMIDESKINPLYEISLEKYVNHNIENNVGTLIQFNLRTGVEYIDGEEYKPLSSTGILLNLPKIEDEYPESIEVIGKSTKATNGSDTARDFDFAYNKENGELKIMAVNKKDEDGNIYEQNVDGARDEYTLICYYSSNCYKDESVERNLEVTGFIEENIADTKEIKKSVEIKESYNLKDNISGLVSTKVMTSDIYNGYINSNKKNETQYKTEYIENLEVNISKKEISDETIIDIKNSFIDKNDNIEETRDIIYKLTKINKKNVLDILGEDGYLQILDENGKVLGEVNKDTEVGDNNIYEVKYEEEVNKIIVKTSKALKVGTILLQNVREIKEIVTNDEINRIQIDANIDFINNVEVKREVLDEETKENEEEVIIEQRKIHNFNDTNIIQINEAKTNIDLTMNKTEWMNNIQNEIEFTVKLIANDIKCKLFENPVIDIKLPNEVEKVILKESSLLYANDGLKIENVEVIEDNGSKVIRAKLSGKQNDYYNNNAMIEATELLIPATVIINKDIYDVEGSIQLNTTNNNGNEEIVSNQYGVSIKSINIQTVENVGQNVGAPSIGVENSGEGIETKISATLGEKALENGQTVYEHEYIRYDIKVKNNSNYRKENINVIGNVPEGTVFVNCYFGEYSFETEDFYHIEEDKDVTEYNQTVSLDAGEEVELSYWVKANKLNDGETQKNIESEVYVKIGEEQVSEYKLSNIIKNAKLKLKITASESDGVGNIWIYHFAVKNTSEEAITNIVADIDLQEEVSFISAEHQLNHEYDYSVTETVNGIRINIPKLEAGEEKVAWIKMQVSRIDENKINFEVHTQGTVKGDNTDTYHSNLNKEKIYTFSIQVTQTSEKEGQELQLDEEVEFKVKIKNISDDKIHLLTQTVEVMSYADQGLIPQIMEYEYERYNADKNGNETVTGSIDISNKHVPDGVDPNTVPNVKVPLGLVKNGEINITLKYKAGEVEERTEVSSCIKVQYDYGGNHVVTSNIIKNVILPKKEEEPEKPEEPKTYSISGFAWEDKNKNGQYDNDESKFSNIIVKLIDANTNTTVVDNDGNAVTIRTDSNGRYNFENVKIGRYILVFEYDDEKYTLTDYKLVSIPEDKNSNVMKEQITVDGESKEVSGTEVINLEDSNIENINIGLVEKEEPDEPEKPEEPKTYSISGFAWEDKNKNGQYDDEESKLSNITVKLVDAKTNKVINNNGNIMSVITDSNGDYLFENVKVGEYILLFEYDKDNYKLTICEKNEVEEHQNSNVMEKHLTIDGNEANYSVTDTLNVNSNIRYINIGLVKKDDPIVDDDTFSISGFAWEDKNKDGKYDDNENRLSNIIVKLFNSETNAIVTNKDGKKVETKTNDKGEYIFEKIEPGKYLVLFEYDSNNYSLTSYKKEMISEDKNSDVIKKQVAIDGTEKTVALTDILTVDESNLVYINMGLIKNEKFDLALDKSITKLKVTYNGFNKEYDYNESKLVKIEIPAKSISGAKIEVQYQIKITNEGDLNGYVDEIVDYLPEGFSFDSANNQGWAQSGKGMLKNTTYAGVIIKPGETKVITLILTRTLTNDSIGTLRNSAEILKSSSVNGDKDIDSSNGNKVETEDDYSVAELIISIKTGAVVYLGMIIVLGLAVLIVLKILVDKKIINLKKIAIFVIGLIMVGIILIPEENSTYTTDRDVTPSQEEINATADAYINGISRGSHSCNYSTWWVKQGENPGAYDWQNGSEQRKEDCVHWKEVPGETTTKWEHYDANGNLSWTSSESCGANQQANGCASEKQITVTGESKWVQEHAYDLVTYLAYHTANGYIHHGAGGENSTRQWYCIHGGDMAQAPDSWSFNYSGYQNLQTTLTGLGAINNAVTVSNNSHPSYLPYNDGQEDNNHFLVGPFNFSTNGEITGVYLSAGQMCDSSGNPISSVPNGSDFYVKVTKNIHSVNVSVNVHKTAKRVFYVHASWTELWTSGSGGQTLGYNNSGDTEGEFDIETYDTASSTATLPITGLEIYKTDYDGNIGSLSGYTVEVKDPYYHYKKTFRVNGTTLRLTDLPGNVTYTITEIASPHGYDIGKQVEYKLDKVTSRGGVVTLVNRQFVDISIEKKVFAFDVTMDGIGFKIYAVTKDGSGWLRSGSCSYGGVTGRIDVAGFLTSRESDAKIFYTDANGKIDLKDLPMGTYTFREVYLPPKYAPWYNMSKDIKYITKNATVITNKRVTGNILIEDTIKRGHLILTKEDYDTKQKLAGAQFNITNDGLNGVVPGDVRYVNMNVTIPSTGMLRIDNLPIGEYTITETKAPSEYNIGLQITTQKVVVQEDPVAVKLEHQTIKTSAINVNVSGTGIVTFNYQNRKYGDLRVRKVDQDTGEIKLEDLLMSNIKFVIAYRRPGETGKRYMKQLAKYNSGPVQYEIIPTDSGDATGAQVFTTDANCEFAISNLPQYYEYFIEEIELPDDTWQYYDIREPYEAKLLNNYDGTTTTVITLHIIGNKQVRVDLEGYVWEDIAEGKTTTRDDLYKEKAADKRVAGLTVYLKKNGQILAERKTDNEGKYFFEARGYKDKSGIAGKDDCDYTIDIDTLAEYVVEFEYNGLKYEKVITHLDVDNGSKATEIDSNRTNFNDNFYNIQKDKTGTNVGLTYTRPKDGTSELVQNTAYTVESVNGSVNPNDKALMLADTKTAGYQIKWSPGVRRVRNINLGIFERAQPDLALLTDINDIELTINGSYSHTYNYKSRSPYINNSGIPDKDINPGYDAALDGFSVGVKRGNGTYRDCSYTREIYDSYLAYTKENKDSSDRLRVFVKYTIVVKNESGSLVSRVKLRNYADTRLSYSSSYYTNGNNNVKVNWKAAGNGIWESEEIGIDIQPAQSIYVYLVHELNTETVIAMVNLKGDEAIQMGETITEISEYSTWDKKGQKYGGIDKDSAPDNISIGKFETYEDDTDVAPGLRFKRKASKVISGLVYEDATNQGSNLKTNEERIGNGRYDNGEKKISNVDVQIVDCSNNQTTKLYNIDASGNVVVTDAKYMTGDNGEYSFVGMVPGRYRVQYTYGRYNGATQTVIGGNVNVTTESYKSTIVNANRFRTLIDNGYIDYSKNDPNALWYWYQKPENFEYSSAVDDYNMRSNINKNLSIINYNVKTNYDNLLDSPENHYIVANTGIMDLPIEDTMIQTTDINYIQGSREYKLKFGIVERPRQSLELNKEISHIRITLPNGQILVDGDPRNSELAMNYVQYPMYGKLKIEVDNEIIEGATIDLEYEITVQNKSELDYDHIRYYRYGDKDSEVLGKLVKINLDAIADYADEKLSLTYSIGNADSEIEYYDPATDSFNNKWKIVTDITTENGKIAGIDVKKDVYNYLKSIKKQNVTVHKSNRKIAPTQTEAIYLQTKKLLTSLGDEDVFDNYAELIQSSNPVGRFYGVMASETSWEFHTPGNFNISKVNENNESDNSDYINGYQAQAVIIPPTGGLSIIIYCSIGIACLVLLAGGIILIKKKVMK